MKKIMLLRKNSLWGKGVNIDVFVNGEKYTLPNNSVLTLDFEANTMEIYAKYLWLTSKKLNIKVVNNNVKITVNQILSNFQFISSMMIIFLLFFIYQITSNEIAYYLLQVFGLTFFAYIIFFMTLGYKNYFYFNIDDRTP
jgi:hypothetical protein